MIFGDHLINSNKRGVPKGVKDAMQMVNEIHNTTGYSAAITHSKSGRRAEIKNKWTPHRN